MIEFRNDSHARLMIRIVHTQMDNVYVDIEDAPKDVSYRDQVELTHQGWVIVEPNDYFPIEKMKEEIL